jgi:hypothetical protein
VSEDDLGIIQADHVFNKRSVLAFPDAWLLIFPTVSEVNYRFGSKFEIGLRVSPDVDNVELTPFHLFKILSNFWPRNREQFEEGLKIISGQNLIPGLTQRIREYVGQRLTFPEIE